MSISRYIAVAVRKCRAIQCACRSGGETLSSPLGRCSTRRSLHDRGDLLGVLERERIADQKEVEEIEHVAEVRGGDDLPLVYSQCLLSLQELQHSVPPALSPLPRARKSFRSQRETSLHARHHRSVGCAQF